MAHKILTLLTIAGISAGTMTMPSFADTMMYNPTTQTYILVHGADAEKQAVADGYQPETEAGESNAAAEDDDSDVKESETVYPGITQDAVAFMTEALNEDGINQAVITITETPGSMTLPKSFIQLINATQKAVSIIVQNGTGNTLYEYLISADEADQLPEHDINLSVSVKADTASFDFSFPDNPDVTIPSGLFYLFYPVKAGQLYKIQQDDHVSTEDADDHNEIGISLANFHDIHIEETDKVIETTIEPAISETEPETSMDIMQNGENALPWWVPIACIAGVVMIIAACVGAPLLLIKK